MVRFQVCTFEFYVLVFLVVNNSMSLPVVAWQRLKIKRPSSSLLFSTRSTGSKNETRKNHSPTSSSSILLHHRREVASSSSSISILELNRPEHYNALSLSLLQQLEKELTVCDANYPDQCRAIVIAARGNKAFSAGHDLRELQQFIHSGDDAAVRELFETCRRVMLLLQNMRPVTIAQVQGVAAAAGCQLVAACDLAVASASNAKFGLSGITLGLACSTPVVTLSHKALPSFPKKALELLLTGDFVDAETAERCGLVNRVVTDHDQLEQETVAFAQRITRHSSYATARGKQLFYQSAHMDYESALQLATDRIIEDVCTSQDVANGVDDFLQKGKTT